MARSDLIIDLVKAGVSGDAESVRTTAEAIAADERAKKHLGVAERISKVLRTSPKSGSIVENVRAARRQTDGSGAIVQSLPERALDELLLEKHVRTACLELVEEQQRADILRANGLEPRHRVLLVGPPETAKRLWPKVCLLNLLFLYSPLDTMLL